MKEFLAICIGMVLSGYFWVLELQNETAWAFIATVVVYLLFVAVEAEFRRKYEVKKPWDLVGIREAILLGFAVLCSDWVNFFSGLFIEIPSFSVGVISYFGAMFWGWFYIFFFYVGVETVKDFLNKRKHKKKARQEALEI